MIFLLPNNFNQYEIPAWLMIPVPNETKQKPDLDRFSSNNCLVVLFTFTKSSAIYPHLRIFLEPTLLYIHSHPFSKCLTKVSNHNDNVKLNEQASLRTQIICPIQLTTLFTE